MLAVVLGGCASLPTSSRTDVAAFSTAAPGGDLPAGWRPWMLSRFKNATLYSLVAEDGGTIVRADAQAAASGLVSHLSADPQQYRWLSWTWKVDALIPDADNQQRSREDAPVRVIVAFDGDRSKLSFDDRMVFSQVKAFTGNELPYATLMYIWENDAPLETVIPNGHTSRIRMLVADSGATELGRWRHHRRDLLADYRQAFGEEPGRIVYIGILTDSDNTGNAATGYYGDIRLTNANRADKTEGRLPATSMRRSSDVAQ